LDKLRAYIGRKEKFNFNFYVAEYPESKSVNRFLCFIFRDNENSDVYDRKYHKVEFLLNLNGESLTLDIEHETVIYYHDGTHNREIDKLFTIKNPDFQNIFLNIQHDGKQNILTLPSVNQEWSLELTSTDGDTSVYWCIQEHWKILVQDNGKTQLF
jgi:hypothetical protein